MIYVIVGATVLGMLAFLMLLLAAWSNEQDKNGGHR